MKLSNKDKIINDSLESKLAQARALKKQQKYQQAIQVYRKVLFLKEINDVLIQLAEVYEKIMDISTALLFYKRSMHLVPRQDIKEKIQNLSLIKGLEMISVGCTKNILLDTEFTIFCKRYPIFHKRLLSSINQKNNEKDHFKQHLLYCLAYLEMNQRALALDQIQNCLMIDQRHADAIILKGILYWSLMQNKKGYQCFWEAAKIAPENQEIQIFLQMILPEIEQLYKQSKYDLITKQYAKCRLKVKKALQKYPHNPKFLILSSYLYRIKEQYQQALSQLQIANKYLDPNDEGMQEQLRGQIALTYNQMGVYLFKHQKYQQAIKLFTQGLSYKPSDWTLYCNRGDAYKSINDLVLALEDYRKAYKIQQKNQELNFRIASIYNLRAIALFNGKKYQLAIKQFNESISFSPRCVTFYASKAKCYIQMGMNKQAMSTLTEAQKIQPSNTQILGLMGNLREESEKKIRNNRKVIVLNREK